MTCVEICINYSVGMFKTSHYHDVIMSTMASEITSLTLVYSTVYSRRRSKKTSKLRATGLCVGNSPVTGEFLAQRASYAENVSITWRHHDMSFDPSARKWKYINFSYRLAVYISAVYIPGLMIDFQRFDTKQMVFDSITTHYSIMITCIICGNIYLLHHCQNVLILLNFNLC